MFRNAGLPAGTARIDEWVGDDAPIEKSPTHSTNPTPQRPCHPDASEAKRKDLRLPFGAVYRGTRVIRPQSGSVSALAIRRKFRRIPGNIRSSAVRFSIARKKTELQETYGRPTSSLIRALALLRMSLAMAGSGAISASVTAPTSVLTMPPAVTKAARFVRFSRRLAMS